MVNQLCQPGRRGISSWGEPAVSRRFLNLKSFRFRRYSIIDISMNWIQCYRTIYLGWGSIIRVTIILSLIVIIDILAGNMFCSGVFSESVSSSEELVEEVDEAEDDEESEDSFTSSLIKPLLSGLFSTRSGIDPIWLFPSHSSRACNGNNWVVCLLLVALTKKSSYYSHQGGTKYLASIFWCHQ